MRRNDVGKLLLLAPLVFICHFLEEAPGFVPWFNAHVARGITPGVFWRVNLTALAITIVVVTFEWLASSSFSALVAAAWFSFLMFANALLHITGALVDRRYVPGLATAVVLYLPYYFWLVFLVVRSKRLSSGLLVGAVVLGSMPMLIHGYRILFLGDRLF